MTGLITCSSVAISSFVAVLSYWVEMRIVNTGNMAPFIMEVPNSTLGVNHGNIAPFNMAPFIAGTWLKGVNSRASSTEHMAIVTSSNFF